MESCLSLSSTTVVLNRAASFLLLALKNICPTYSINIFFRYDGGIFDLRHLKAKTKVLTSHIEEAQYADDIDILCNNSNIPKFMQTFTTENQNIAFLGDRVRFA